MLTETLPEFAIQVMILLLSMSHSSNTFSKAGIILLIIGLMGHVFLPATYFHVPFSSQETIHEMRPMAVIETI